MYRTNIIMLIVLFETVRSLENACHMLPERLRGIFTTNARLPLPYLYLFGLCLDVHTQNNAVKLQTLPNLVRCRRLLVMQALSYIMENP